ncbi:aspartate--tRNA ligase [candidate division KSB1 bacterium]|nr:aspartate--tRNA ligase [candidate division KSB1 bacterium]
MKRTHTCGGLNKANSGQNVLLQGWVENRRDHGGLIFIDIRDRYGKTQLVFDPTLNDETFTKAKELRPEYVIEIEGSVHERPSGMVNPHLKTGEIEVSVNQLAILNKAKTPPFLIVDDVDATEETRLRYRYLDLRRAVMQKNLILRHRVAQTMRQFLDQENFLEIETPYLMKSTPEGARDFLVPSRIHKGKFYALPQSPQIYKQTLMISGYDRYFQIVRCFRDEDLRADRQPEFTQLDVEMAFVREEDIRDVVERLMVEIFARIHNIKIERPFPVMTYDEAMAKYGCDKPDLRFGMPIVDITDIVKHTEFKIFQMTAEQGGMIGALCVKGAASYSRKQIDLLNQFVLDMGGKGVLNAKVGADGWESSLKKFLTPEQEQALNERLHVREGDLILIIAASKAEVQRYLGELRLKFGKQENLIPENSYQHVWITEFPMFEYDDEADRFVAMHHPFTSPVDSDVEMLDTNPELVRAKAYDLVLNGHEVAGGSIRIHSSEIQSKVFSLLKISKDEAQEKFGFLLEALQHGAPPHGGIAFGLDRLIMILAGRQSLRDVIAFPKTTAALSLMDESPSGVSPEQLKDLGLRIENTKG